MSKHVKKSVTESQYDSGDEDGMTQTLTQAEKSVASLSTEDKSRKVSDLVMYLLIADQKKIPIKRTDICKNVLKEHAKAFNIFIQEAAKRLQEIFGIILQELDTKQKSYILVSDIDQDSENPHVEWPDEDNAKTALLMVVLSLIFMNGNIISDSHLYTTLKKLGIEVEHHHGMFGDTKKVLSTEFVRQGHHHEMFGDTKKVLSTEFVRQGYLEYNKTPNTEPPVYEYTWGQRAKHETSKRMVLNFVCQIYGEEMQPESWTSQYQDVLRSEGLDGNSVAE